MKASLILCTLSLFTGVSAACAKQLKPYEDPHSIQGMHHDEAGTVTYRGELGGRGGEIFSLKIGPAHEGKSWVAVYVGANGCLGDIAGMASGRGDVLDLAKDDQGNVCSLTRYGAAIQSPIAVRLGGAAGRR